MTLQFSTEFIAAGKNRNKSTETRNGPSLGMWEEKQGSSQNFSRIPM
jgi:hypothetical protein